ncbi:LysR family transcriptional regulator [Roseovarius sp. ZX-A-9]|uniref:LysR family transcriptional regulator n=1 Tax=Roseovarius sp. ZX-A-9 TaxID=3014783 RepID=UPI00232BE967|nr:LysR family transcriptional regulator [Roseovarius sp. ZX-A-9]
MAIKIEMLRCFIVVAELGNISDAGERLGRTPSAVSMTLKQLEENLGAALFESDRKNRLTALGRFTLNEARREVDHFTRCIETITGFAKARIGFVRVGAVPSVAGAVLPLAVQAFVQDHPEVVIHIQDMDSTSIVREVEMGQLDLGIASCSDYGQTIKSQLVFTDDFGVVCQPNHPLAGARMLQNLSLLAKFQLISNASSSQIEDPAFRQLDDGAYLKIRNTASVLGMVRAGVGITVLPRLAVDGYGNDLCFVPLGNPRAQRRVSLLTRSQTELSPAAKDFGLAIIQGFKDLNLHQDRII